MKQFEFTGRQSLTKIKRPAIFTLDEAVRTLPLVERIVGDIVAQYRELERLHTQRRRLRDNHHEHAFAALDRRAAEGAHRLNDLIKEVNAIGCEMKDFEAGVVDFRALRDGREIYLCWKLGEDSIRHWHELHGGAITRRPIDAAIRNRKRRVKKRVVS